MKEIFKFFEKARGITSDSRKVKKGYIFVAYKGVLVDGHDYIQSAIKKGAILIVGEEQLKLPIPYVRVDNGRLVLAKMWSKWYGNPEKKLKIIGVTGTDGKTTTSTLIYEVLKMSGKKVGLISTVSAKIGNKEIDTGFHTSTPDPDLLFALLDKMVRAGCEYAVLEATSHSLAQYRDGDLSYDVGVFTNLANEHLDLHGSTEAYKEAKGRLFQRSEVSILNDNSDQVDYFRSVSKEKVITYNKKKELGKTTYTVERDRMIQKFEMRYKNEWITVRTELPGEYNRENILAASKVAEVLNINTDAFVKGIAKVKQVKGRFELVKNDLGLYVVVDFAHTDQAIQNVLSVVKDNFKGAGKIITVFGCIGERGKSKRELMGKEACKLSDYVVITADDPRNEPMDSIFSDVIKGCNKAGGVLGDTVFRMDDRESAIKFAITELANSGDWIMLLGKGHEKSINIEGVELPWNDVEVVKKILNKHGK